MFGRIEVDNIAKWIYGDTIDEGSYRPNPKEGCGGGCGEERERAGERKRGERKSGLERESEERERERNLEREREISRERKR